MIVASDIDLAVEILPCDEYDATLWPFELCERMRSFLEQDGPRFHLSASPDDADHLSLEIVTAGSTLENYLKQSSLQIYP